MKSERLGRRITIQKKTVTQNTAGEEVETWNDLMRDIAAGRRDVRASERFGEGSDRIAEIDTVFTVRWSPALNFRPDTYRIREGNPGQARLYDILGMSELGRREGYEIAARARAEDGYSQNA